MRKVALYCLLATVGLSVNYSSMAGTCGAGYRACNHHTETVPMIANPGGCNQLQVTIHNKTVYSLKKDEDYPDSSPAYGVVVDADGQAYKIPKTIRPGEKVPMFYITGEAVDSTRNDEVDKTVKYWAYSIDKSTGTEVKTGADVTLHFVKSSCNISLATCIRTDTPCYCRPKDNHDSAVCDWNMQCTLKTYCDPQGCVTEADRWEDWDESPSCDAVPAQSVIPLVTTSNAAAVSKALYFNTSPNASPQFQCDYSSVCDGKVSDENRAGLTQVDIYASPIETLTVTFPFNTKTPMAQVMKDSIYNNLNAKYVGQLGSYISFSPVVMADTDKGTELKFSTLCNSADCPQASPITL